MSGRVTITAAAPSDTPAQSNRPSGSAMIGAFSTVSSLTAFWKCAFGFFAPLAWLLTETCAIARLSSAASTPCLLR
ncbi:hypothetical protein D3C71_1481000 [compost metagenome]